jgi:hypothetical protein
MIRRNAFALLNFLLVLAAQPVRADLKASASCSAGRVVVVNRDADHWMDVKIEVNHEYSHQTAVVAKGDTMRFVPSVFTKTDGTRLDLGATTCKSIEFHATVNGKRDHWNGATR